MSAALGVFSNLNGEDRGIPMALGEETASRHDLRTPFGRLKAYFLLLFADHGILRLFYNLPTPITPQMYRSSQPAPRQIRKLAKQRGFKTIINLRGTSDTSYHALEKAACEKHGVTLVDFQVRSRDVPSKVQLHAARELFEQIEYPALMHCKSGADRAGLMSALYVLIKEKRPVEDALQQLSWRYGHWRQAKTGVLDYFLEQYRDYNAKTPIDFFDWVDNVYDPVKVKSEFMAGFLPSLIVDRILRRE